MDQSFESDSDGLVEIGLGRARLAQEADEKVPRDQPWGLAMRTMFLRMVFAVVAKPELLRQTALPPKAA